MKRILLFLPLAAFLSAAALAQAATEATVDLSGAVIQNGKTIDLTSPETLDSSLKYEYAITGTCHGTGTLQFVIPAGTSILDAMQTLGASSFAAHLTGTVADPDQIFPLTVVNQAIDGGFAVDNFNFSAHADVLAEIDGTGAAALNVDNVSVMLNGSAENSSIVFEDGAKCVVSVKASLTFRPDVSLEPADADPVGDDVYQDNKAQTISAKLAKGSTTNFSFYVANDGSSTDKILVKATPTKPGYKIKYMLGTFNVTNDITTIGIGLRDVLPGQGAHILAQVTVKKTALKNAAQNLTLKIKSKKSPALVDQATYALKVGNPPL